jgi:hypothetical protein
MKTRLSIFFLVALCNAPGIARQLSKSSQAITRAQPALPCYQCYGACKRNRLNETDERTAAFSRRLLNAFRRNLKSQPNDIQHNGNNDQTTVPFFAAKFTKTLEHDPSTGLATVAGQSAYKQLLKSLRTGRQADFNAITRAPGAFFKLVNPQGAFAFSIEGKDSSTFKIPEFPRISSPEAAALMIEEYLMALARDIRFEDYGTGQNTDNNGFGQSITQQFAQVLQDLGSTYTGPRTPQGTVDAAVLFRDNNHGSLIGPYISQFLLLPVKTVFSSGLDAQALPQDVFTFFTQQFPIPSGREFGVSFADFVALQDGKVPKFYTANDYNLTDRQYIINGRDLASYFHFDTPYQALFYAINIIASNSFPFSQALPYSNGSITQESSFVTMGSADAYALIGKATLEALKACWAQKWRAYRALRPEAFAGLVHNAVVTGTNPFNLDSSLFTPHSGVNVLALVLAHNQEQASFPDNNLTIAQASTYLLSQVYPEASPAHPSYVSGHAAIAGACITVIKAIYEDTTLFASKVTPVKPDPNNPTQLIPLNGEGENAMTLGSELDKLASNMSQGRSFAGIHYRLDLDQGILLGEAVAIQILQDHAGMYNERTFKGFELTKFNGQRIRITTKEITVIS